MVTSFYTSEERDADLAFEKIKSLHTNAVSLTERHEITIPFIEFSNMIAASLLIIKQCKAAINKQMC
ncbi:hypothetical protein D3C86_2098410 [compost metagenome]